jgi:hypothetical protein
VTLLVVLLTVNWMFWLLPASQRIAWAEHYSFVDPFPGHKAVSVAACAALALLGLVGFVTAGLRRGRGRAAELGEPADRGGM